MRIPLVEKFFRRGTPPGAEVAVTEEPPHTSPPFTDEDFQAYLTQLTEQERREKQTWHEQVTEAIGRTEDLYALEYWHGLITRNVQLIQDVLDTRARRIQAVREAQQREANYAPLDEYSENGPFFISDTSDTSLAERDRILDAFQDPNNRVNARSLDRTYVQAEITALRAAILGFAEQIIPLLAAFSSQEKIAVDASIRTLSKYAVAVENQPGIDFQAGVLEDMDDSVFSALRELKSAEEALLAAIEARSQELARDSEGLSEQENAPYFELFDIPAEIQKNPNYQEQRIKFVVGCERFLYAVRETDRQWEEHAQYELGPDYNLEVSEENLLRIFEQVVQLSAEEREFTQNFREFLNKFQVFLDQNSGERGWQTLDNSVKELARLLEGNDDDYLGSITTHEDELKQNLHTLTVNLLITSKLRDFVQLQKEAKIQLLNLKDLLQKKRELDALFQEAKVPFKEVFYQNAGEMEKNFTLLYQNYRRLHPKPRLDPTEVMYRLFVYNNAPAESQASEEPLEQI